jgi:hypothetical protein
MARPRLQSAYRIDLDRARTLDLQVPSNSDLKLTKSGKENSIYVSANSTINCDSIRKDLVSRLAWSRARFPITLALALTWLALPPSAEAVDPPPDGGYPYLNTAEGTDALFNLTTGTPARQSVLLCLTVVQLQSAFKAQAAQIQKLNERLELNKTTTRVVVNDQ